MAYAEGGEGVGYYSFGSVRTQAAIQVDVWNVNASTAHVKIQGWVRCISGALSQYGTAIQVGHGEINGAGADWHEGGAVYNYGNWVGPYIHEYDVPRGIQDNNLTCWVKYWGKTVNGYGGARNSGELYLGVTIPHREWKEPPAPTNVVVTKRSDNQAALTWNASYTDGWGDYPITGFNIERLEDGKGSYIQIAQTSWEVQNFIDNSITSNHSYRYRVLQRGYAGNSGYGYSSTITTTPAAPLSAKISKTDGTTVKLEVDGSNIKYPVSFRVEKQLNSSTWSYVGTYQTFPITDNAGGGTARYRVRAEVDSLVSDYTESNTVTTITPPLSPAIEVTPKMAAPVGSKIAVSWIPNHPDGSAQSMAQVEYRVGSTTYTETINGKDTTFVLPDKASAAPANVYIRVRTKGLHLQYGSWSSAKQIKVAYPPNVIITSPSLDNARVAGLPLVCRWSVTDTTGVASQYISLYDNSGNQLFLRRIDPYVRSFEFNSSSYVLSNMTEYRVVVDVAGGSSLTARTERTFATKFAEPRIPIVQAVLDDKKMAYSIVSGLDTGRQGTNPLVTQVNAGSSIYGIEIVNVSQPQFPVHGVLGFADKNGTEYDKIALDLPAPLPMGYTIKIEQTGDIVVLNESGDPIETTGLLEPVVLPEFPTNDLNLSFYSSDSADRLTIVDGVELSLLYPKTIGLLVMRDIDGEQWVMQDSAQEGMTIIDPLPPLNKEFYYDVIAMSETGSTAKTRIKVKARSRSIMMNFGAAANTAEGLYGNLSWSEKSERATELYNFADGGENGGLPMAYGGETLSTTHSIKGVADGVEQVRRLIQLMRTYGVCWVRDLYGNRYLSQVSGDFSADTPYDFVEVNLSLSDTVFEEAW